VPLNAAVISMEPNMVLECLNNVKVKYVPGKGMGLFAVKSFKAGDLVAREKPLLVMPDEVFQMEDMDKIERWIDKQVDKMTR